MQTTYMSLLQKTNIQSERAVGKETFGTIGFKLN